ncbi:MAG: phosphotransferase [Nanoarchaeota archaeon]|nr:phosphotransferase [Nanoarchaeota archaeon]
MEHEFYRRIGYSGSLQEISEVICNDFNLGTFVKNTLLTIGYEDFNVKLETSKGNYFVKIFANFRDLSMCERYVKVMLSANKAGVQHPGLYSSSQGYLHQITVQNTVLRLVVMEYLDGKDLFHLGIKPNEQEIRFLARQAANINGIKIKPTPVYDSWAVANFPKEYHKKWKYLEADDLKRIKQLFEEYEKLHLESLPKCFVHGDIISTNVLKDAKQQLWIIDFAVSNYYPRIQELAVLACNLLFVENKPSETKQNLELALKEYQKHIRLLDIELKSLPVYIKLAHAMHVLCANYEKQVNANALPENEYWLGHGRAGLGQ